MKGFMMKDGDLVIANNEIELAEGDELTAQTIQSVLSTDKGEWLFDTDEGIEFMNILGKVNVTEDVNVIKSEIEQAIEQVNSTWSLDTLACEYEKSTRVLKVRFTMRTSSGEMVEVSNEWQ